MSSRLRPADGAVAGVVLGALLFAGLLTLWDGGTGADDQRIDSSDTVAPTTSEHTFPQSEPTRSTDRPVRSSTSLASTTSSTTTLSTSNSTRPPDAVSSTSTPPSTPIKPEAASTIDALLGRLRVEPERSRSGYDRSLFEHWIMQHNGCSTREQVLINESTTPPQVDPYGCKVVVGDWTSAYDGYRTEDPNELDIDHVVALAEAWDSGADGWDAARRRAFANDLEHPGSLVAVTASTNQSKRDRDPASWQPPDTRAWCAFATDWSETKIRWGLSADQSEVDALRNMLTAQCPNGAPRGSDR